MVDMLIDPAEFGKGGLSHLNGKLWSNQEVGVELAGYEGDGSVESPYEYGGSKEYFYVRHDSSHDIADFVFPLLSLAGKENYLFYIRAYGIKFVISLEELGGTRVQTYLQDLEEDDALRIFATETAHALQEAVREYKKEVRKPRRG
ncbi:hypothetical protein C5B42_05965 [Candidatus Cerribacteria bacterium 'Amazon FNV 2010 28 9']|uniref:Uncharacterized protein n=1 Tax=Candidatus Cerribacteria bacterium 'Amazon FNV 2010 28 9' TaxID=2081795 RepID=A0A317JMT3_9BACT|nr:MAG: hypothetical protein C5B42_05965 [Candidatus Cerribacteria bacterium 'Amazon FNV 2010 28 9']